MRKEYYGSFPLKQASNRRSTSLKEGDKSKVKRLHESFKRWHKVIRRSKNPATGFALVEGFNIQCNFLRPHEALFEGTPASASGIVLPPEDG